MSTSYEAAERLLSSRTLTKTAINKLPVQLLSQWCNVQGITVIPTGKRSGCTIKPDYVDAILKFVRCVSICK